MLSRAALAPAALLSWDGVLGGRVEVDSGRTFGGLHQHLVAAQPNHDVNVRTYLRLRGKSVKFNKSMMQVTSRMAVYLPSRCSGFRHSCAATAAQRMQYEIGGGGISLHWPELDEDLSIAGLMAGVDWETA